MTPIKTIAAQIDKEQHKKQGVIRQAENYKRFRGCTRELSTVPRSEKTDDTGKRV